ncbi:rust resistance kinase Lr10-like [Magnolia sinica]|uniref:rust resistance kinase Lr10-like n=1 Tax=Magnolia sinica TaxID=86752 RepID=UPI0026599B7D|nr:rust resistance kinase Lr10-like [Magnolia sinica]
MSIWINYNARIPNNTPAPPMQVAMQVIPDSKLKMAMMEEFIDGIAREKLIRFSRHQLANFTRNYTTRLGSGGYGVVYKGEFPNGVQIAVKVLNGRLNEVVEEQFMAEVGTIGRTHHINLVKLHGFCFDAAKIALVYEYMGKGSVDKLLFNKDRPIGLDVLHKIAVGTAKGIAYIHEGCKPRIIHYDIKPENVLLDENFTPKVADFGLSKICSWNRSQLTNIGFKGTPGYAAPEMWAPYPITYKCDVYSFGMFLFEIVGRRRNFDDKATESQKWFPTWVWDKFENGDLVGAMELYGIEEKDRLTAKRMAVIALWCVQFKPETRPPMSSVVKMLEGEMEIIAPPNPFQHLMPSKEVVTAWTESDTNSTERSIAIIPQPEEV